MTTNLQPAAHPDAEQLAAFAEHALPAHEQAFVLEHLAGCRDCREVVFLAQEGVYEEIAVAAVAAASVAAAPVAAAARVRAVATAPIPLQAGFSGWLTRWNLVLPAAALAIACFIVATVYVRRLSVREPAGVQTAAVVMQPPTVTAQLEPAAPGMKPKSRVASPAPLRIPPRGRGVSESAAVAKVPARNGIVTASNAPPQLDTTNATLGGTIENELYTNAPLSMGGSPRDPAAFQHLMPGVQEGPPPQQVARAQLAPTPSASAGAAKSGLQQGVYGGTGQTNLNENYVEGIPVSNVQSQGDNSAVAKAVSVDSLAVATPPPVPSPARVGIVGGALASRGLAASMRPRAALPSHLATVSAASSGGRTLAVDSAGAVFLSTDAGVTWKPVAAAWKGRAVRLSVQPSAVVQRASPKPLPAASEPQGGGASVTGASVKAPQLPGFELTTDSGAVWTSADGLVWTLKQ